jgi:hypothetical protein
MAFTALILMDLKVKVIMRRFHVPNFTSQLQSVGSIGIESFTFLFHNEFHENLMNAVVTKPIFQSKVSHQNILQEIFCCMFFIN